MEKRLLVANHTKRLMLVFTEPEAQDYWLVPGESVELRAETISPNDDFVKEETKEGVTIWPSNGMGYIAAYSGDVLLACGHQRPVGWP